MTANWRAIKPDCIGSGRLAGYNAPTPPLTGRRLFTRPGPTGRSPLPAARRPTPRVAAGAFMSVSTDVPRLNPSTIATEAWHASPAEAVAQKLNTHLQQGLTPEEA